ncbi:hypothetical protein ABFS83_09G109100 [Erythranthe nasuta]
MGSCEEEANNGIDPTVGGLVWVRRRNGSWWPGRILGPDELPEGCVPTPRSGTPVKLLGREDASVDWYNLEKSKRVKAFRCGEYDDCIEKAKACASSLPSKKAVKYARREDAILHALTIENARLGKDTQNEQQEHHENDESPPSSLQHPNQESKGIDNASSSRSEVESDSGPDLARSGVSFEDPDQVDRVENGSKRWRTPNDSEEDGTEGVKKRMRGLEDLGMNVKTSSKVGHPNEFLNKRKNRRRALAKVLESTPTVCVPVSCEELSSPNESKVSGLESKQSNINGSLVMNNNSDSTTGVSYENGLSLNISTHEEDASLVSKSRENEISSMPEIPEDESSGRLFDVPLLAEDKHFTKGLSLGNEEHNETCSTSSDFRNNLSQKIEKSTSEWQLKGKRNSRPRKIEVDNEAQTLVAATAISGDHHFLTGSSPNSGPHKIEAEEFRGWSWNTPRGDSQRPLPYRQSRFTVNPKYDSSDFSLGPHHSNAAGAALYEVKVSVEVKTGGTNRPQHVPYISLMSKSNGRPIVGHPLSIEVLSDGHILECYSSSSEPARSNLKYVSGFRGGADVACGRKPRGRPAVRSRSSAKSRKSKRNGLLSKKIRKLSSLSGPHGESHQQYKTKTGVEKVSKGPSVACVPLNVVFSRINAALNSSIRHAPRFS